MIQELKNKIDKNISKTKSRLLDSDTLYQGKFIELVKEQYLLPNNKIMYRERIIKNNDKDAVLIIAITKDNQYILVFQNRIDDMTTIEFPSGYIEKEESAIEAGYRELLEETGYISHNIRLLDSYCTSLGIDSSIVNIVIAYDCVKYCNQNLGEYEYINYDTFSFEELTELVKENYMKGVGNKLAYYELLDILNRKEDKKVRRKHIYK